MKVDIEIVPHMSCSYKRDCQRKTSVATNGTYDEKFRQSKIIARIVGAVGAFVELDCTGSITVYIGGGDGIIEGDLKVANEEQKLFALKEFHDIEFDMLLLSSMHPQAKVEVEFTMHTTFAEEESDTEILRAIDCSRVQPA